MNAYDIIKKPLLSEKTYGDFPNKKYWFIVDKSATKVDIKNAVEKIFKYKKLPRLLCRVNLKLKE